MRARIMANLKLMAVNIIVVCSLLVLAIDSYSPLLLPRETAEMLASPNRLRRTTSRMSPVLARFKALVLKRSAEKGSSDLDDLLSGDLVKWDLLKGKSFSDDDVSREMTSRRRYVFGDEKWAKKSPRRFRREEEEEEVQLSRYDQIRMLYEERLFVSLKIIGNIQPTRLYVREDPVLVPVGTIIGKVRKLHPYGKVIIVWPYFGFRNFTVNEDTGDVTTTALMDFELIRIYNMTIRDFQFNYTDDEPLRQPPSASPKGSLYVDHYLIVEVVDLNDNQPIFFKDSGATSTGQFEGRVNQNARAGTPILRLHPTDDDSGPRGRIRYEIVTTGSEETPFTIDPQTSILKTNGKRLATTTYIVQIKALDYGMPPKDSGVQTVRVTVEKAPPEFLGTPYNFNFSEASVRGSIVANVKAISRSGMPMTYLIIGDEAKKTFDITHLGQITLLRELDYDNANETDKIFRFDVQAKEFAEEGQPRLVTVNLRLVNADDHLGTFKTPATKIRLKEGRSATGGDVFTVEVDDCDCRKNCRCGSNEMIFTLGNTSGFFDITADGQVRNVKELDYEKQNYFFFPVNVTDPGFGGRTRTSYIEVYVEDIDDTPPEFPVNEYKFFIFEDAPKGQVVGVAQAVDPDPSTRPDDVAYSIKTATPREGKEYFAVGNQGVITVNRNTDQFKVSDKYELVIKAIDSLGKTSDPTATVIIRVLDVNDHQPVFSNCEKKKIKENQAIGTVVTTLTATDQDRGLNKLIEYSIQDVEQYNFFAINNNTGEVTTTHVLDREKYDSIFVVAKATDGGSARSDALRQIGYCQFIVVVEDVNDHHPMFTVKIFDVSIKNDLAVNQQVLLVEAVDPDLGDNAKIEYRIKSQKKNDNEELFGYFGVIKGSGSVVVKKSLKSFAKSDKVFVEVEAYNTVAVVGSDLGTESVTTVIIAFMEKEPLKFTKPKYIVNNVAENIAPGATVLTVGLSPSSGALYSLQKMRDRESLPFTIGSSSGHIRTTKTLNYERKKSYLFAVTAGSVERSSAIVQINIKDLDDVLPIFGNNRYEATVSEAAKGDTNVFRVKATDPDPSSGGPINYKIQPEYDYQSFIIEKRTNYAQIKTKKNIPANFFDREKKDVYTIIIEASREKLKSTASVIIKVRDENDSPPVFKKKFYNTSLAEGFVGDVHGIKVEAVDNDILENANVSYFLTSGNDGRFEMETVYDKDQKNYGQLKVVIPLDVEKSPEFEKNPVYILTVTATDRKHTDKATITIKVLDKPETRPEFVEDYYEKYLPENVGPGVNVVQVQVKKPENVEFSLEDIAKQYFTINKLNGLIKTGGELLDWEKTPVITFPVYAYDTKNPTERGQTFVRVKLNDVNDARPYFPDQPYIGYIRENKPPGTMVRFVNGKDLDNPDVNSGNNVKLRYELLTNTGRDPWDKDGRLFKFNSQGLLVTKVMFNVEEYSRNLTVRVRAWDNGNPRLSGETDVTIVIRDVNEFPALFRKPRYEASVSEIQPPGFVVLQLTVKDRDFAPMDNYAFSMLSGNEPYAFDIQQKTGEIVVAGVLDYEVRRGVKTKKVYELKVGLAERSDEFVVKADGVNITEPFQDLATVVITILPGNDNRPTFDKKIYTTAVSEKIAVGTALNLSIEATDEDVGFSNKFRFLITKGNMGDWFGIRKGSNPNKAVVFVQNPLDREYQSTYVMEIIAKDNGGVFDVAKLVVTVTDVNDNAPVFQNSYYYATISEPSCNGHGIATLIVTDPDRIPQGPFIFDFARNGNPGNRFGLRAVAGNTTELYCKTRAVDREATSNFVVTIKVTDNPLPQQSSTATVFVNVEDLDDSPAKSGRMRIIVNAIDGKFGGGPVGKTYFQDNDGDADSGMKYSLTGSDEFTVKQENGWISAKSTVKVGKYELKIQGTKSGGRPSCDVDVDVRNIPKDAIKNSAAIQLDDLWKENQFFNPIIKENSRTFEDLTYYDRFVDMLSDLFNVAKDRVFVFSIQMSAMVIPGKPAPSVDVRFAIEKESPVRSKFLPRHILINMLEKNNKTLQKIGFKLGMIGIDYCVNETLRVGMCKNDVVSQETYTVVSSDYGLLPAPTYAVAVVSIDTVTDGVYARYKTNPDPEYDECITGYSCLNGGVCHDVFPHGFVCECLGEYSGPRCQTTTRTFLGSSYIWLAPKTPYNYGSISFEFATEEPNGLLLYQGPAVKGGNNGRGDFLAISLVQGKVKVALSFGGKPLVFTLDKGKRLNDKKWHHVEVAHERKDVTLTIDHCKYADIVEDDERIVEQRENCEIISRTMLNFEYINGLGPIQVGGVENMPLEYPSSEYVQYTHFRGCIRKIYDNLEMYDLGYPLKVVDAPVGCTVMAPCPSCLNGGYCHPGFARSVCACKMGFTGDDCSGNAPRFYYLPGSFTEYKLPGEERRRKRGTAAEPADLLDRYGSYIAMQLRINPEVDKAYFLYVTSETNLEYSILGYEDRKLYFEFKLLDAYTRLEMPGEVEIADGNWHNVVVTRQGNMAVLQVDYIGRVSRNTGGAKRLIRMSSAKLFVGGMPNIAPNATIANKTVEAKVTDIRTRRRRSAGTILGVTTDGRPVKSVDGDMTGCTGSSSYNGQNMDTDPNIKAIRFNVETGCPCREVQNCFNGGVCVSAKIPFCLCTRGWSGPSCEEIVYIAPVLGNRVDGRARWKDGGVLIIILCVVLCVIVLAIALLFVKKRREAPYSVPVGDEGQDSIMPYHDDGAGEEDTFNYDIHHLMKISYRDGHGTVTKGMNGGDIPLKKMEQGALLSEAPRDSIDLWPFIQERVQKADEDTSWWPGDEMRHWDDEGDDEDAGDLSEIGESDDEGAADAVQDWDFLKDLGKKFENLDQIFNPDDDEDEVEA